MYYHVQGVTSIEGDRTYIIMYNYENKIRIRYVVPNEESFKCWYSYRFFDSDRIPCAHMLLIFTSNLLREILAAFIVNRWIKTTAKVLMYEFYSVLTDACGEICT